MTKDEITDIKTLLDEAEHQGVVIDVVIDLINEIRNNQTIAQATNKLMKLLLPYEY